MGLAGRAGPEGRGPWEGGAIRSGKGAQLGEWSLGAGQRERAWLLQGVASWRAGPELLTKFAGEVHQKVNDYNVALASDAHAGVKPGGLLSEAQVPSLPEGLVQRPGLPLLPAVPPLVEPAMHHHGPSAWQGSPRPNEVLEVLLLSGAGGSC